VPNSRSSASPHRRGVCQAAAAAALHTANMSMTALFAHFAGRRPVSCPVTWDWISGTWISGTWISSAAVARNVVIDRGGCCAGGGAGSRSWRLNRSSALRWMAAGVALDVGEHLVRPRYGYDFGLDRKRYRAESDSRSFSVECMGAPWLSQTHPQRGGRRFQAASTILCPAQSPAGFDQSKATAWRGWGVAGT